MSIEINSYSDNWPKEEKVEKIFHERYSTIDEKGDYHVRTDGAAS